MSLYVIVVEVFQMVMNSEGYGIPGVVANLHLIECMMDQRWESQWLGSMDRVLCCRVHDAISPPRVDKGI